VHNSLKALDRVDDGSPESLALLVCVPKPVLLELDKLDCAMDVHKQEQTQSLPPSVVQGQASSQLAAQGEEERQAARERKAAEKQEQAPQEQLCWLAVLDQHCLRDWPTSNA